MALELEGKRIEAVLLDVDGTLYLQPRLRALMLVELALLPWRARSIGTARRVIAALRQFRRDRERLRDEPGARGPLEQLQYEVPARRLGCSADEVRAIVDEWIHQRPLRYLERCRRPGLLPFLDYLTAHGARVGAFSDYPVEDKLTALGVADAFPLRLCATDRDIDAFKPDPTGFLRACDHWQLAAQHVLYIGDRFEVDGRGACAAGMPCVIIGAGHDDAAQGVFGSRTFAELRERLRAV